MFGMLCQIGLQGTHMTHEICQMKFRHFMQVKTKKDRVSLWPSYRVQGSYPPLAVNGDFVSVNDGLPPTIGIEEIGCGKARPLSCPSFGVKSRTLSKPVQKSSCAS